MKKTIFIVIFFLLLIFLILEGILRLCYIPNSPTLNSSNFEYHYVDIYRQFFKRNLKDGKFVYVSNANNFYREFSVIKQPDTIRIFILGGSIAQGFDTIHFENIFKSLIPDKNFEIVNCGMDGYDSYRVHLVEKEILNYEPDLIIVLSGNNEFHNPVKINLHIYYFNKILRRSYVYIRLQDWFRDWYKERVFLKPISSQKKLIDYEKNIRNIVYKAKQEDIPIILCALPVNFRDCPPNIPYPLDKLFLQGLLYMDNDNYSDVIVIFKKFLKNNPDNPYGLYYLGRAYDKIEKYQKAKSYYLKSLDLTLSHRATPSINNIIRQICKEEDIGFADIKQVFIDKVPNGLLGRNQFFDNCHWYFEYYNLAIETILKEIFQNDSIYSKLLGSKGIKPVKFSISCNLPSLSELGKREFEINRQIVITMSLLLSFECNLWEEAISNMHTLYLMNPESLWKVQFLKGEIKEKMMKIYSDSEYSPKLNKSDFNRKWTVLLYHIGETYRRLKLYQKSLAYFNKAIEEGNSRYFWPYLGKALLYHAMGDREKASKNISIAEKLTNSLEVKYYKEILGL